MDFLILVDDLSLTGFFLLVESDTETGEELEDPEELEDVLPFGGDSPMRLLRDCDSYLDLFTIALRRFSNSSNHHSSFIPSFKQLMGSVDSIFRSLVVFSMCCKWAMVYTSAISSPTSL